MELAIGLWTLAAVVFGIYLAINHAVKGDKKP